MISKINIKDEKDKVLREIEEFKDMFKNIDLKKSIEEGTWLSSIISKVLCEHAKKIDPFYFKKKYPGIDNERIAYRLIDSTAKCCGIAGGVAASAVTAAEFAAPETAGMSLIAMGSSVIGEISYITYLQLKLVYDISIVLNAPLDKDDPEDMLTLFWYAFGINIWENVTETIMAGGPKAIKAMARKALRAGIRKAIKEIVGKVSKEAGKKITEKALLKLLVPVVNIPTASFINYRFTRSLGKKAITNLKHRGIAIRATTALLEYDRKYQLIAIPLIYHIGIYDEEKDCVSRVIEMQSVVVKKLCLQEHEYEYVDNMIAKEFNCFCDIIKAINSKPIKEKLFEIAVFAFLLSKSPNSNKLYKIAQLLDIALDDSKLNFYKKQL